MTPEFKYRLRGKAGNAIDLVKLTGAAIVTASLCVISFGSSAHAQSTPSFSWGTGTATATFNHLDAATMAVLAAQGNQSVLPGASVVSTGVLNTITVVGDNNLLTTDQQGENNGDVSSTVNVNQ